MKATFNHEGNYVCECGKEFTNSQSFNGHKSSCLIHREKNGTLEDYIEKRKEINKKIKNTLIKIGQQQCEEKIKKWEDENHACEKCGKIMKEKFGSGRFCSRKCSNSRDWSNVDKSIFATKIRIKFNTAGEKSHERSLDSYNKNPKKCRICGNEIPYESRNKNCCSEECKLKAYIENGKKSSQAQSNRRRSKNEILFFNKCFEYFQNVTHNDPMFDGWDADIIIHDIKYAVLWNGVWHYKKITEKHSVKQVQNRDRIKIEKIKEAGYTPYIIKDMGKYNENFVCEEFEKFLNTLKMLDII